MGRIAHSPGWSSHEGQRGRIFGEAKSDPWGLFLASILYECPPQQIIYTNAVERIVRKLFMLKRAVAMEKNELGASLVEKMSFTGIGGGALPEKAELL